MPDETGKGRLFTQEEVRAIFSRAVDRQSRSHGGLTYDEIVDAAQQAGISTDAIRAAVAEADSTPPVTRDDEEVLTEISARSWRAKRAFAIHFTVYAMVMALLAVINWQTARDGDAGMWVLYPLLGWGIGVAAHFTSVAYPLLFPDPRTAERVRSELRRRREKRGGRALAPVRLAQDANAVAKVRVETRAETEEPAEDEESVAATEATKAARRL